MYIYILMCFNLYTLYKFSFLCMSKKCETYCHHARSYDSYVVAVTLDVAYERSSHASLLWLLYVRLNVVDYGLRFDPCLIIAVASAFCSHRLISLAVVFTYVAYF